MFLLDSAGVVSVGLPLGDAVHYALEGCLPILERRPGLPFADDECAHGRLAGDPTVACGCWPGEGTE